MGTYIEEIPFPAGPEVAKNRVTKWREVHGNDFKLVEKGDDWIHISHKTMHFVLTFLLGTIRFEGWVGGVTKYSISPKAFVGAIARREGWSVYQTLRSTLTTDQ